MQRAILPVFLLVIMLFTSSFKPQSSEDKYSNSGYFMAIVGGGMFELRDNDKYRAEMRTKGGTMNNNSSELNRSATSIMFYGNSFTDADGKSFDENLNVEYTLNNGGTGEVNDLKIDLNYDKYNYYQIPEKSSFQITKIEWSADHKNCLISADFNCKMRRWGFPADEQPIVRLKGRMVNINVMVPPWIASKLNVEASIGQ